MSMTKEDTVEVNVASRGERLLDLRTFFREIWRWKWILMIAVIIGAAIGVRDASKFVPTYEATMILMPLGGEGSGSSSPSGGGRLAHVAQSFGLSVGGTSDGPFDLFRLTVGSTQLARNIQEKYGLLQTVYRGSWDEEKQEWIKPDMDENSYRQRFRRFFHLNPWRAPDLESLASYLAGTVRLEKIENTSYFKINVVHTDREFALQLLKIVYLEIDHLIGSRRWGEQKERKEYLERQIETTQMLEVRKALLSLLMQKEKQAIIIDSEPPYSVQVLEPPHASTRAKEPALQRIIAIPIAISVALVLMVVTIVVSFRTE
jgi:hypothetical protein